MPYRLRVLNMLSFKRSFQTRAQALEVYKTQLSSCRLFVESFEGASKDTPVRVTLQISESDQSVALDGTVERAVGKKEAVELGFGTRPGLLLSIPITPEIVAPLRAFFLAQPKPSATPAPSVSAPFETLAACSPADARREADTFLSMAHESSLYRLFHANADVSRAQLRQIYNKIVRTLHPDKLRTDFDAALCNSLADCYQILNEAYKILQNGVENGIYLEISRQNNRPDGMSLEAYKKFLSDYRLKNANNIRLADELVRMAQMARANGNNEEARSNLKLALSYDALNEPARAMMMQFDGT